jgi:ribose transport system substrate-binding protein
MTWHASGLSSWKYCSIALCLGFMLMSGCVQENAPSGGSGSNTPKNVGSKPRFAFITNCAASFWTIARHGVEAAGKDFDVETVYREPKTAQALEQKEIIQDLLTSNIDGIAITPISPDNQLDILNEAADNIPLICHDSDAPKSKRLVFIGVDNYVAGRLCGKLVKEALPNGGTIMLFVGRMEQLNAKLRRQGIIDELFDRSVDPTRYDELGKEIKNEKYTILDTRTDQDDRAKAKSLAEDAITKYPDLGCMIGLFAYNPPILLQAVKNMGNTGKTQVVGFDEEAGTLQGIIDGGIYGSIVQDPYNYGYKSIEILTRLYRKEPNVIPESKYIEVPAKTLRKDNVQAFWDELKKLVGDANQAP